AAARAGSGSCPPKRTAARARREWSPDSKWSTSQWAPCAAGGLPPRSHRRRCDPVDDFVPASFLLVHPVHVPESSLVEGGGDFQQGLADDEKEKPRERQRGRALREPERFEERGALGERRAHQFFQAGGTNDAVIVLGDAFAAEKARAFRTARGRLAQRVIEAALLQKVGCRGSHFRKSRVEGQRF